MAREAVVSGLSVPVDSMVTKVTKVMTEHHILPSIPP